MRRIIHIFNKSVSGAEYGIGTYIHQLISNLKKTNLEFDLINLGCDNSDISVSNCNGYKEFFIPETRISNIKTYKKYYAKNVAYLLKVLLDKDKDILHIFHLNYMNDPHLVFYLKKLFKKCKILLVLHYTDWSFGLLGDENKLHSIMERKCEKTKENEYIYKSVKEDILMIKRCDKLLCVAKHSLVPLKKYISLDKSNSEVVNNALVDVFKRITIDDKIQIKNKYFIEKNNKILMFAGRLNEVKGLSFLIEAFKKVLRMHPNSYLILAGEGDFRECFKLAGDYLSKIIFTGRLDKNKLYELYSIADIGIMPSLHEEFGFVAIEMMMHEVPIITTDTGGLSEIVENNVTGLKVPIIIVDNKRSIDVNELADKIIIYLNNPTLASRLGRQGRDRYLRKYESKAFVKKMTNIYYNI